MLQTSQPQPSIEALLDTRDVMKALNVCRSSVWKLMKAGKLTPVRILGRPRFRADQVRALQSAA